MEVEGETVVSCFRVSGFLVFDWLHPKSYPAAQKNSSRFRKELFKFLRELFLLPAVKHKTKADIQVSECISILYFECIIVFGI